MRVLVTGHNGYIGSVMTRVLAEAGHDVVGMDTYYYAECTLGRSPSDAPALRRDTRDVLERDLFGFEAVIHLAALSNDPLSELNPDLTYEINYRASVRLAQAAKRAGVLRFLFHSSCSMYGAAGGEEALTEEAPLRPVTHYAVSKVRTEEDLGRLAEAHFSPVFLRNATAYGVSPRMRVDLVLNNLVGWAYTTGKVVIMSDGTPWRPLVHVEDIAWACEAVLAVPREVVHNQAFNVGRTEENYQVRQIAEMVREIVPGSTVTYGEKAGPDARNYRVSFEKIARTLPQFQPRWTARAGIQEVYGAYRDAGLTREEFLGRKFVRVNHLKQLVAEGRLDESLRWRGSAQ